MIIHSIIFTGTLWLFVFFSSIMVGQVSNQTSIVAAYISDSFRK